jgi:hypothetical protein
MSMENIDPATHDAAEAREIAQQIEVELGMLLNIEESLQLALQWMTRDRGNSRKLSTLRSAARTFERQLTRTRMLADHGGYQHLVTNAGSQLSSEATSLTKERDELQANFERIVVRLEYVSPDDGPAFATVCVELEHYLTDLKAHGRRELSLLHRSSSPGRPA